MYPILLNGCLYLFYLWTYVVKHFMLKENFETGDNYSSHKLKATFSYLSDFISFINSRICLMYRPKCHIRGQS